MANQTNGVKWGVLCEGTTLPRWQALAVEQLLHVPGAALSLALIAPSRPHPAPARLADVVDVLRRRAPLWDLYGRAAARKAQALAPDDIAAELGRAGALVRLDGPPGDDVLARVREADLDFLLWLGDEPPRGPVLGLPRHGVWHLRAGDPGGWTEAPCFAELVRGERVASAALLRGEDEVLRRGVFPVAPQSYAGTLDAVLLAAALLPADACRSLLAGAPPVATHHEPARPRGRAPDDATLLPVIAKVAAHLGRAHLETLLWSEQWNIGVVDRPIDAFLAPGYVPEVRWLPTHGRHRYLADPFGLPADGGAPLTILAEDYDHRTLRAIITSVEQRPDGTFGDPRPVLDLPLHLSYPYLFTHAGETYCIPATEDAGEVRLYRLRRPPFEWELVKVLIPGFAAADPTLFQHEGRFWLFGNDHLTGSWTRLHAFHAPDLLGPWEPHALNPIKVDVRSARSAGSPFTADGQLYRPAQDCSRAYGGAVTINRVVRLTPTEFAEEPVKLVEPDPASPFPAGLHTIASVGGSTLIDAKRMVFVGAVFRRELGGKVERLARRFSRKLPGGAS